MAATPYYWRARIPNAIGRSVMPLVDPRLEGHCRGPTSAMEGSELACSGTRRSTPSLTASLEVVTAALPEAAGHPTVLGRGRMCSIGFARYSHFFRSAPEHPPPALRPVLPLKMAGDLSRDEDQPATGRGQSARALAGGEVRPPAPLWRKCVRVRLPQRTWGCVAGLDRGLSEDPKAWTGGHLELGDEVLESAAVGTNTGRST